MITCLKQGQRIVSTIAALAIIVIAFLLSLEKSLPSALPHLPVTTSTHL